MYWLVKIYGLAEIISKPSYDATSNWRKIKRDAKIEIVERSVPRKDIAEILDLQTNRHTMHKLSYAKYVKFENYLGLC